MSFGSYKKLIFTIFVFLAALIAVAGYFLYYGGPRVRFLSFESDISTMAYTSGSSMNIVFDRPLKDVDYTQHISFIPTVDFTAKTNGQFISIVFNENLKQDTKYQVIVEPEIYDNNNIKMKNKSIQEFSTAPYKYAYIERNYIIDSNENGDENDYIKSGSLNQDSEILFSYPIIRSFEANREYSIVAGVDVTSDALFIVNNNDKSFREVPLPFEGRIQKLSIGVNSNVGVFILQPDFNSVSSEYYQEFANSTYSLNLETGDITQLLDETGTPIKSYDIALSINGQYLLTQDERQIYYFASPYNDFAPSPIGSFTSFRNFKDNGQKLIFREVGRFVTYSVAEGKLEEIEVPPNEFIQDTTVLNNDIALFKTSFLPDSWQGELVKYQNQNSETLWQMSSQDIVRSTPNASYDGKVLSITVSPESCQQDSIGVNSACRNIRTEFYDINTQETISTLNGFDLTWLP